MTRHTLIGALALGLALGLVLVGCDSAEMKKCLEICTQAEGQSSACTGPKADECKQAIAEAANECRQQCKEAIK